MVTGKTPGSAGKGIKKIFATSLSEVKTYDAEGLGAIRFEGNSVYKWVKYAQATAAVDGVKDEVAYYMAESGYADNEVTSDLSDSASIGAGVLMANVADGEYCWVKIKGTHTLALALTAGADGNALTPVGAGDGTLDVSALVTDAICAYAIDASANLIICDFPF